MSDIKGVKNVMIKNVIFDIAKVLVFFDRDVVLKKIYNGEDYKILRENLFVDWEKLDEDTISQDEYDANVLSRLPSHLHRYALEFLHNWESYTHENEGMFDLVKELKDKGFKLFALSNMTRQFIKKEHLFPVFSLFDGIVYSAPIGLVKPNKDIYEYLLSKYNLNPKECVFIDDQEKNLEGASRFNIKTYLFNNDVSNLRKFLLSL